jgi:IS30 family transposase
MPTKHYNQLSLDDRDKLARLFAQGHGTNEIARRLGRHKSTVSRELRRNASATYGAYGAGAAAKRARDRKRQAARRMRLKDEVTRRFVHKKLREGWSPEQIAATLSRHRNGRTVSHEAIYQYIYTPSVRRQENLVPLLPRAHKRRLPKGHRRTHRDLHIPQRVSISRRPAHVKNRRQAGHWESDSVCSRTGKAALHLMVERKSRLAKITKLSQRSARPTRCAITRSLSHYPKHLRRSITYDNGSENVEHVAVNKVLNTKSYFTEPYRSWEKPTVENTAGLVRRAFPKKTRFDDIPVGLIKAFERRLNNRPRKCLSFRTPREVFKRIVALAH